MNSQGVFKLKVLPWLIVLGIIVLPIASLFLYYPVSEWISYRQHRSGFDAVYDREILPGAAWVRQYYEEKGKLPTEEEYWDAHKHSHEYWSPSTIIASRPPWQKTWGTDGSAFMIRSSVNEWNLFYQSWDGKRWWLYTE